MSQPTSGYPLSNPSQSHSGFSEDTLQRNQDPLAPYPWLQSTYQQITSSAQTSPHHAYLLVHEGQIGQEILIDQLRAFFICYHAAAEGLPHACGSCDGCRSLQLGTNKDNYRLPGEGQVMITVDSVRKKLLPQLSIPPASSANNVVIIDNMGAFNDASGNAILKTLEEPPPRVVFLALMPAGANVLQTIRSRCLQIKLPAPTQAQIRAYVDYLVTHGDTSRIKQVNLLNAERATTPKPKLRYSKKILALAEKKGVDPGMLDANGNIKDDAVGLQYADPAFYQYLPMELPLLSFVAGAQPLLIRQMYEEGFGKSLRDFLARMQASLFSFDLDAWVGCFDLQRANVFKWQISATLQVLLLALDLYLAPESQDAQAQRNLLTDAGRGLVDYLAQTAVQKWLDQPARQHQAQTATGEFAKRAVKLLDRISQVQLILERFPRQFDSEAMREVLAHKIASLVLLEVANKQLRDSLVDGLLDLE